MRFEILGIELVDYVSRKTGRPVKGTNLHCINLEKNVLDGQAVERLYVKEAIDCTSLHVGDRVNVYYNRFGSVDDLHLC